MYFGPNPRTLANRTDLKPNAEPIWPRDGVIYSWLFKYAQQHTAGFTQNNIVPAPPKAGPACRKETIQ